MVVFPDVQKKAQAELDEVVGRGKSPTFADYDHLPYIRALVKETLRWRSAFPLGIPHRVIQDDTYEGYRIPKGATCIPNVW
jgi:cytochrome P450